MNLGTFNDIAQLGGIGAGYPYGIQGFGNLGDYVSNIGSGSNTEPDIYNLSTLGSVSKHCD